MEVLAHPMSNHTLKAPRPTTTHKPRPQASPLSTHQGLACQPTPRSGSSVTLANHYLQTATTSLPAQYPPRAGVPAHPANWVQRHAGQPLPTNRDHRPLAQHPPRAGVPMSWLRQLSAPRTACGAPAANWVQRHAGGYIWVGAVTLKRERAFSMTVLAAVHRFSRAAARAGSAPFTRQEL